MKKINRINRGRDVVGNTWDYIRSGGSWPAYRIGMILDSHFADIRKMELMLTGVILVSGKQN